MTNPSKANLEVAGNPTDIVDCTIQTTLRDGTYIVYELLPTRKVTVREVDGKVREYNTLEEVEIPGFTQQINQVVSDAFGLSAPLQDQCQMQEEHMESSSSLQLSGGQLLPAISPLTNSDPRVQSQVNQVVPDRERYPEDEEDEGRSISLTAEVREWKQSEQPLFQRATSMPRASLPPDGDSHWSEENKYLQQATPVNSNSSGDPEEEDNEVYEEHVYFQQATPVNSNSSSGSEEEDAGEEEEDEEHLWFQQATPVGSNYFGDPEEENNEEYEEHVYFQQATPVSSNSSSDAKEEDGEEEDEAHQYFQQATPVSSNYFGDPEEEYEEHQVPFRASFSFRSSVKSEEEVLQNEVDRLTQEDWLKRQLVDD